MFFLISFNNNSQIKKKTLYFCYYLYTVKYLLIILFDPITKLILEEHFLKNHYYLTQEFEEYL